ncbi:MAG: papain-like cysteine protease family protein [Sandaracinaceae bacterium]
MTSINRKAHVAALLALTLSGCCEYDRLSRVQGNLLYDLHVAFDGELRMDDCELRGRGTEVVVTTARPVPPQQQLNRSACWAATLSMLAGYHGVETSQHSLLGSSTAVTGCEIEGEGIEVQRIRRATRVRDHRGRSIAITWLNRGGLPAQMRERLEEGPGVWLRRTSGHRDGHAYVITSARFRERDGRTRLESIEVRDPQYADLSLEVSCPIVVRETLEVGFAAPVPAHSQSDAGQVRRNEIVDYSCSTAGSFAHSEWSSEGDQRDPNRGR